MRSTPFICPLLLLASSTWALPMPSSVGNKTLTPREPQDTNPQSTEPLLIWNPGEHESKALKPRAEDKEPVVAPDRGLLIWGSSTKTLKTRQADDGNSDGETPQGADFLLLWNSNGKRFVHKRNDDDPVPDGEVGAENGVTGGDRDPLPIWCEVEGTCPKQ
ncbi:hypothetical protein MMC28_001631 [Mycoblastus sanguinarius]|nr:hypothetical protein [Mycoblastus sanguinarius]